MREPPFSCAPPAALLAVVSLALTSCSNFHAVEPGRVYRSAQPDSEQLAGWLSEHGIKTTLRLRGGGPGNPDYDAEHATVTDARATLVHVPMTARNYPSREALLALWDTFEQADYPMLVHCLAGADRTGLASAIYVLQRTGDLAAAKAQLGLAYGHVGWGTNRLDRVLEMYGRWHGRMDFRTWVEILYWPPGQR